MKTFKILTLWTFLGLSMAPAMSQVFESAGPVSAINKEADGLLVSLNNARVKISVFSPSILRIQFSKTSNFETLSYAVVAKPEKPV
ncbi:MAG TPA: DUF4968 domain-containing protein, partial [Catalimonadaceae bacterium]|nr:DUF4968 domain-containing protein [Catalimonadaceae bacterium]